MFQLRRVKREETKEIRRRKAWSLGVCMEGLGFILREKKVGKGCDCIIILFENICGQLATFH